LRGPRIHANRGEGVRTLLPLVEPTAAPVTFWPVRRTPCVGNDLKYKDYGQGGFREASTRWG